MGAARKVSEANRPKLTRLLRVVNRLPERERPLWRQRIRAWLEVRSADVPPQEWTAEIGDGGDVAEPVSEWDLWLANKLDGAYTTVSDRVVEVAEKGAAVVSAAGFSLWPLAAVALVAYLVAKK